MRKQALRVLRDRALGLDTSAMEAKLVSAGSDAGGLTRRRPDRSRPGSVTAMARLVFLGTPEAAVAPLRTLVDAGHDVALVVSRPDKRRGRGSGLVPSPVKAAATELGLAGHRLARRRRRGRGRARRGGGLRPDHPGGRARPAAHGQPALLPAAPVAGGGPGGAGHPGGRRRDRGVPDGGGGRARHRRRSTPRRTPRSARRRRPTSSGPAWWPSGCGLLAEHLADGLAGLPRAPRPGRRAVATPRRSSPASSSSDWEQPGRPDPPGGPAGPGLDHVPRAGGCGVLRGRPVPPMRRRTGGTGGRARAPLDGTDVVAGGGTRLRLVTVQPEGRRPMDAGDWLRGVRPGPDERLGGEPDGPGRPTAPGRPPVGSAAMATLRRPCPTMRVAPSILSADFGSLSEAVDLVAPGHRLAPRRRHGRPLRPQPDHRSAGGGVAARAHRPVLRHPPDDHRPGPVPRGVPRRRRRRVHGPRRGGRDRGAGRPDARPRPAGGPGRQPRHPVRGGRALPRPGRPGPVHDRLPRIRRPVVHRRGDAQGAPGPRGGRRRPACPSTSRWTAASTSTPWSRRPGRGPTSSWPARRCSAGRTRWRRPRDPAAPRWTR